MIKIEEHGFAQIRKPFAFLENESIKSTSVWFKVENGIVASWEDSQMMLPRWCLSTHSRKEAVEEIMGMLENKVKGGWKLVSTTEKRLKSFVVEEQKIGLY